MDGATLIDDRGIKIRVLGPVEVMTQNGIAQLGGPKQRALLAMLAARAGRVVTTNELIDGIWGEEPPNEVLNSIHTYVSHLRTIIDQPIERRGSGYLLGAETAQIDANVFEEAAETGRRDLVANPTAASDRLRRALALWRGGAYADVADFPGMVGEAQRLSELRLSAVEARIEADLTLGRHAALIGELESLTTEYPLRESLRAKQMLALYREGRQADALRAFRRTEEYLREELGIDPSTELQELESRILNHDYTLIHSREVVSERVALLFTDIVHSTLLWESNPAMMQAALARHDDLIQTAIESAAGTVIKGLGDGFIAAFSEPALAARAAVAAQQALTSSDWSPLDFSVRMALDTGEVERRGGDLFGSPMNRGSRLLNAAHGGQILLSNEVQREIKRDAGTQIKSLGEHRFKGLGAPIEVYQLVSGGLRVEFPAPQTSSSAMELDRSFGDSIRGYELRERIGRGAFATVYRGFQPSIGREVAIKIVKPEFANHPAFVRRFESEARFVASLEHPHIVSVYDYWRDADGAYVVGPYLAGRSLADAVFATMTRDQVMKLATQVGSALSYAHRQGVLHRDIKPANVLLDRDGNAYVADFGIAARAVEEATGVMSASAGYRAPEDERGEAVDLHSDIYSLAALVAHLLTGRQPGDFNFDGLDQQLRHALERGLASDPLSRPESVDQFLELLAGGGTSPPIRSTVARRNPFKGLAAFQQTDAADFFGRANEIIRLVAMVLNHRLSAVIGPSGSGKSSLVLAGLLPALHKGAAHQSETWVSVKAVPGGYPFDELATALSAVSTESLSDLATELAAEDGKGLLRVAKRIGIELDGDLVIVLDQFEELFTLVVSASERNHFVSTLVTAASDPLSRVRIVLTLRADFFHQVLSHPELGPVISLANLALAPLDSERIRLAIVEPARKSGLELEPGLADRIIADLADQPGSLPLLQFTLDRLTTLASEGQITNAHYDALGGVKGALAERAQTAFQTLTERQQAAAQQIFTRLLTVSDEADDVRLRVRVTELKSLGLPGSDVNEVLDTFGKERLLTFDVDSVTRGATVEVAHEALLREWPNLRAWVDSRRESLVLQRRFQVALGEWEESDRSPSNLLVGGKLSQYEEWAAVEDMSLTTAERGFLDASIDRATFEAAGRRTRRRQVMVGFASAAVVALLLAFVALVQRGQAEDNATRATASELAASSRLSLEDDPELAILLALEAVDLSLAAGEWPLPNAIGALQEAMQVSRVVKRFEGGDPYMAVSPDGRWMVLNEGWDTEGPNPIAIVYDFEGEEQSRLVGEDSISGLEVSPDGALVAVGYNTSDLIDRAAVLLFDPLTGEEVIRLEGPPQDYGGLDFSTDGTRLLAGSEPVMIWDVETGEPVASLRPDVFGAGFLPGGEDLLVMLEGERPSLGFFSLASMELTDMLVEVDGLQELALDPDRTTVALGSLSKVVVYDLITREQTFDHSIRGDRLAWSPDGRLLAVANRSETLVTVFDVENESIFLELRGASTGLEGLAFTPDGKQLLGNQYTEHEQTLMWDISENGRPELGVISTHTGQGGGFRVSPDQTQVAAFIGDPPGFELLEANTGDLLASLSSQLFIYSFRLGPVSPDVSLVGSLTTDFRSTIRRLPSLDVVAELDKCTDTLAFSPDSSLALVRTFDCDAPEELRASRVIDIEAGVDVFELPPRGILAAAFNPPGVLEGGRYLVLTDQESVEIWDLEVRELVDEIHNSDLRVVAFFKPSFDAQGRYLALPTVDGRVVVFDLTAVVRGANLEDAIVFDQVVHTGPTLFPSITLEGVLITGGHDKLVRMWDLHTGELLVEFRTDAAFNPTPVLSSNESFILYSGADNLIRRFYVDPERLVALAESLLTRGFTDDECRRYPVNCPTTSGDS